jgi:hypothetical protein
MAAYGFEDNYAKTWPSGETPLKAMRRVIDCGQVSVVGVGKEAEQFDMEVPIRDGRLLSESEIWLSLTMRIEADAEALNGGGTGAGSGGNQLLTVEVKGKDKADGDLVYMTETRNEKGQAVSGSSIYVAFQDHNFYVDEEKKRAFFYVNTTLPIFRQSDAIGLKKAIVRLALRRPFADATYEYRVEAELNYCVVGTPLKEEAGGV